MACIAVGGRLRPWQQPVAPKELCEIGGTRGGLEGGAMQESGGPVRRWARWRRGHGIEGWFARGEKCRGGRQAGSSRLNFAKCSPSQNQPADERRQPDAAGPVNASAPCNLRTRPWRGPAPHSRACPPTSAGSRSSSLRAPSDTTTTRGPSTGAGWTREKQAPATGRGRLGPSSTGRARSTRLSNLAVRVKVVMTGSGHVVLQTRSGAGPRDQSGTWCTTFAATISAIAARRQPACKDVHQVCTQFKQANSLQAKLLACSARRCPRGVMLPLHLRSSSVWSPSSPAIAVAEKNQKKLLLETTR